jgi:hypothetical protein
VVQAFNEAITALTGATRPTDQRERDDALQRAYEFCRGYVSYVSYVFYVSYVPYAGAEPWRRRQTTGISVHLAGIRRITRALTMFTLALVSDLKGAAEAKAD